MRASLSIPLALSLLCSACHVVALRAAASVPTQVAGDGCPAKPALMTPAEVEACAPDPMHRPHIDYGDVVAFTDLTYGIIPGFRPLKMTFYVPQGVFSGVFNGVFKGGRASLPLVVFVHGGGWQLDPEGAEGASGIAAVLQLARGGYVVAVPGYRLSSEAVFPAQLQDVKTAIRYAKTHAVSYGADAARTAVWGASAGGNLAALVATTCGLAQFEPASASRVPAGLRNPFIDSSADSCVRTAVDWFGPIDFSTLDAQAAADGQTAGVHGLAGSPESRYIGCAVAECAADRVQAPNPIRYIGPRSAPTLIMHGHADRRVPWQQSQQFYDALRAQGVETRLLLVPDADHEFAGLSDESRREQVDRVIEWLTQTD